MAVLDRLARDSLASFAVFSAVLGSFHTCCSSHSCSWIIPDDVSASRFCLTFLPHVSASRFCLFFGLIPDRIRHSIARVACGSLPLTLAPGQPPRPQPPREQVIFNPNSRENHHFPTEHLMFTPSTQAICIQNVPKKCYRAGVLVLCTARVDKHLQHSVDLQGCF